MISEADIRRAVPGNASMAGLRLFQQGAVRSMTVDGQGGEAWGSKAWGSKAWGSEAWGSEAWGSEIEGRVAGSGGAVYRQRVVLGRSGDGGWQIKGTCTCYVGGGCKHVAALLFHYRAHADDAPSPAAAPSLPPDVAAWLRSLDAARQEDSEDYPPSVRKRLIYVLDTQSGPWRRAPGTLAIGLQSIELKRDGTTQGATRHDLHQLTGANPPKFLRPSDRAILARIARAAPGDGAGVIAILRAITATGRGRWGTWTGPVLVDGPALPAPVEWQLANDGTQTPTLALPPDLVLLRLPEPWYASPTQGTIGPVETGLPPRRPPGCTARRSRISCCWPAPCPAAIRPAGSRTCPWRGCRCATAPSACPPSPPTTASPP